MPHAFKKEIRKNGVGALYDGVGPYLLTYCTFIALQFSIYERVLKMGRDRLTKEEYLRREFGINCFAGGLAGGVAAGFTNALEAITVAR